MATSTLLQTLDTNADGMGVTASNRRQTETFLASAAIGINALVALDLSKTADSDKSLYVIEAINSSATSLAAIGFAINSAVIDAGERVQVCISGICEGEVANGGAVGDRLVASGVAGVAGVLAAGDTYPAMAICIDANSSGGAAVGTVQVLKQF